MMFETALVSSGFTLEQPTQFANKVFQLLYTGLADDAEIDTEQQTPEVGEHGEGSLEDTHTSLEEVD